VGCEATGALVVLAVFVLEPHPASSESAAAATASGLGFTGRSYVSGRSGTCSLSVLILVFCDHELQDVHK
jgi:hypothetical protein